MSNIELAAGARWAGRGSRAIGVFVLGMVACKGTGGPGLDIGELHVWPRSAALATGDSVRFVAYGLVTAEDSTPVPATWAASGGTITAEGLFRAGADTGTFYVWATDEQKSWVRDSVPVSVQFVPPSVVALALSPENPTVAVGAGVDFVAVGLTGSGDTVVVGVSWEADGGSIVPQGPGQARYTPDQVGTFEVVARLGSLQASTTVTAEQVPVASVSVAPASATVSVGTTVQLTATPRDGGGNALAGRPVTWTTGAAGIATVNASGLVTGQATGTATITATSEGKSGSATVTVSSVPVASVAVSPASATLTQGQTVQLTATPRDAGGNPLTGRAVAWSTSAASVATVSTAGLVTANAPGSATITATSEGKSGTATVTVSGASVASVTVSPASASLYVHQTVQLAAIPRDSVGNPLTGRPVTWSTSGAAIATVSGTGLVTATGAGTATITATSEGKSGAATMTVTVPSGCSAQLSDVSLPLCDGTYTQSISSSTFSSGSVIQAVNPGKVRFTGSFRPGNNLTFRGIVVINSDEKGLGSGNLYEEMSFVGGPACGNTVNVTVGSNTTIRRSAVYGRGGRYQVLVYQKTGVRLEDVMIRSDGGWGVGSSGCTEFEPNAALNSYDSSNFTCLGCILFDAITEAHSSSEVLGGLGVNCHDSNSNMVFENSLTVNSRGAYWAEGNGSCDGVIVRNTAALGNVSSGGWTRNVSGRTDLINFTSDRDCRSWEGTTELTNSSVRSSDGCNGSTSGAGASITLNTAFLDNPRWRQEMCTDAGVTRGWCATTKTLSEYLASF
jgi:uncharacterized protein YjdB